MTQTSPSRQLNRRSMARFWAVCAAYQIDKTGGRLEEVLREYYDERLGKAQELEEIGVNIDFYPADRPYFTEIVTSFVKNRKVIDRALSTILGEKTWPLERLDAVLRALLQVAGAEFMLERSPAAKVIINDFIEVAKGFFDAGAEVKLLNSALDHLAQKIRPEELAGS